MSAKALMFQILDWLLTSQTKGRPDSDSLDSLLYAFEHVLMCQTGVTAFFSVKIPYLLEWKMGFFPLSLALKYVTLSNFTCKALNWRVPYWITLNWTMQTHTKACMAKLYCEICAFLGHYTAEW